MDHTHLTNEHLRSFEAPGVDIFRDVPSSGLQDWPISRQVKTIQGLVLAVDEAWLAAISFGVVSTIN